ncbi:peroxide stress protein YaaA [Candidatus Kinetoplastidibacterium crithidiae]|uniref:peroxide stress protein YaaA n=1 Tax=Candidatus Kinetoplastidibacterium crithidiae TaxID=33056 RepID=UPI0021F39CD2|nr:peroxide stress protein YaaA [Candidatus Kinetoplastibacterium crithidii]
MFTKQVSVLLNELQRKSANELSSLMKISKELAELNVDRYLNWENSKYGMASAFFLLVGMFINF